MIPTLRPARQTPTMCASVCVRVCVCVCVCSCVKGILFPCVASLHVNIFVAGCVYASSREHSNGAASVEKFALELVLLNDPAPPLHGLEVPACII